MDYLSPSARRAAARARWLAELESALDHCDELARALRSCPEHSEHAAALRADIETAREEVDRIRRARPRVHMAGDRQSMQPRLAAWRGNRIN